MSSAAAAPDNTTATTATADRSHLEAKLRQERDRVRRAKQRLRHAEQRSYKVEIELTRAAYNSREAATQALRWRLAVIKGESYLYCTVHGMGRGAGLTFRRPISRLMRHIANGKWGPNGRWEGRGWVAAWFGGVRCNFVS